MPETIVPSPNLQPERQRSGIPSTRTSDLPGQIFGRWQVMDKYEKTKKGEKKWLCRCECGTERYVLERALKSGSSMSCGCLHKERLSSATLQDLTGRIFGELTAVRRVERNSKNRGAWWYCVCSCGNTCEALGSLLTTGKKTHCGCKAQHSGPMLDIQNQTFGRLTAQYPTQLRDRKGSVVWHCRCACGREVDASYNDLMYSNLKSCGCRKKEHDQKLRTALHYMDGTSLEMISSKKIASNNTSGHRGVYYIKGKYVAKIVFQKKAYYLGAYASLEAAVEARKEAEEAIFLTAVPFYEAWEKRGSMDPKWAEAHPVKIQVKRNQSGRLYLEMTPNIQEIEKNVCRDE